MLPQGQLALLGSLPPLAPGRRTGFYVMDRGPGVGADLVPDGQAEEGRDPVLEGSLPGKLLGR